MKVPKNSNIYFLKMQKDLGNDLVDGYDIESNKTANLHFSCEVFICEMNICLTQWFMPNNGWLMVILKQPQFLVNLFYSHIRYESDRGHSITNCKTYLMYVYDNLYSVKEKAKHLGV